MSLADQIAALSKRITDVRGVVPSYEWATVATVSPPTVILDSDVTNTPRPVADVLVANLAVADRVEVRAIGSRRDVIARAGGAPAAATAATPDTLILRDANGRAKVADPSEPDDIDTMGARDAAIAAAIVGLPRAMASGTVATPASTTTAITGVYYAGVTVTFPMGRFTVPPVVTVGGHGGIGRVSAVGHWPGSVTTAGFTARVVNFGGAIETSGEVHWHAIQMTDTNASG